MWVWVCKAEKIISLVGWFMRTCRFEWPLRLKLKNLFLRNVCFIWISDQMQTHKWITLTIQVRRGEEEILDLIWQMYFASVPYIKWKKKSVHLVQGATSPLIGWQTPFRFRSSMTRRFSKENPVRHFVSSTDYSNLSNLPSDIITHIWLSISSHLLRSRCTFDRIKNNLAVTISKAFILIVFKNSLCYHISASREASLSSVGPWGAEYIYNIIACCAQANNVHFNKKESQVVYWARKNNYTSVCHCHMHGICFVFIESVSIFH